MRFIETMEKPKAVCLASLLKKKKALAAYFKNRPVDLVFVHGSLAKDCMKSLSDVDIAVLFRATDPYLSVIQSVFRTFEIPYELHERFRLRLSPIA